MIPKRILILGTVLISISCNNPTKIDYSENANIKNYLINYSSRTQAFDLQVFDNNDTIYVSNNIENLNEHLKIKSDVETINNIKQEITDHLNYKSLLVEREFLLHKGYLNVSISSGDKEFKLQQSGVDNNLKVSKKFYKMINNLKNKYSEFELLLKR